MKNYIKILLSFVLVVIVAPVAVRGNEAPGTPQAARQYGDMYPVKEHRLKVLVKKQGKRDSYAQLYIDGNNVKSYRLLAIPDGNASVEELAAFLQAPCLNEKAFRVAQALVPHKITKHPDSPRIHDIKQFAQEGPASVGSLSCGSIAADTTRAESVGSPYNSDPLKGQEPLTPGARLLQGSSPGSRLLQGSGGAVYLLSTSFAAFAEGSQHTENRDPAEGSQHTGDRDPAEGSQHTGDRAHTLDPAPSADSTPPVDHNVDPKPGVTSPSSPPAAHPVVKPLVVKHTVLIKKDEPAGQVAKCAELDTTISREEAKRRVLAFLPRLVGYTAGSALMAALIDVMVRKKRSVLVKFFRWMTNQNKQVKI